MATREAVIRVRLEDGDALQVLGQLQIAIKKDTAELAALNKEIAKNGQATVEQQRKVGELTAKIESNRVQFRELKNDLSGATAAGLRFRDVMAEASRQGLAAFGLQMLSVAGAVTAAIGVLKDAGQTVVEFNSSLAKIRALGGEYAANIEAIAEAAKSAGAELGITANESLKAIEALAKAGVSAADILGGSLDGALTLAAAGSLDVADAAETAANAMVQFGLAGEDVPHIADLLAAGAASATGEVADFAAALRQSGLVASQFGLSIEETVGGLTAFAAAGLVGSDAGTSLKSALLKLGSPSKEAAKAMQDLGINAFDAQGKFVGLEALAGNLKAQLQDLTQEQRANALATIFGTDAVRVANVLYEQGAEGIKAYTEQVNQSGFASKVAKDQTDTLAGSVKKLGAAWDKFILSIEDGDGVISRVVRGAIDVVKGLIDTLADLNGQGPASAAIKQAEQEVKNFLGVGRDLKKGVNDFANEINALEKSLKDLRTQQQKNINEGFTAAADANEEQILSTLRLIDAKKQEYLAFLQGNKVKADAVTTGGEVVKMTAEEQAAFDKASKAAADYAKEVERIYLAELDRQAKGDTSTKDTAINNEVEKQIVLTNTVKAGIDERIKAYEDEAAAKIALEEAKQAAVQGFADAFQAFSNLAAQDSAAQKALAIASALTNTYLGVTQVLAQKSVLPEPAATAAKVVSIATVLATGLSAVSKIRGFAEGGYTGPGGKHEPAGVVHRGEYVLPQGVVNTIGVPALDQLVNALSGRPTQSGSSYAAGGAVRGTALVNMRGNDILSDPSILAQVRQSAALSAFASQPIYTSWVEGQAVGRRVQIIEQRSSI